MEETPFAEDLTKLTEFRPLSPEPERSNAVVEFFSRFFTRHADESASERHDGAAGPNHAESGRLLANDKPVQENSSFPSVVTIPSTTIGIQAPPSTSFTPNPRSLSVVTNRITTLLNLTSLSLPIVSNAATGSTSNDTPPLLEYERSDLRQYWMPDSRCKECYECREKFTTFRRRHHCRICGQIFCSKCCKQEIPGRLLGYVGSLRLCDYCSKAVAQYLKSPAGEQALSRKISLDISSHDLSGSSSVSRKTSSAVADNREQSPTSNVNREEMFDRLGASYFMAYPSSESTSNYSRSDRKQSVVNFNSSSFTFLDRDGGVEPANFGHNLSLACFAPDSLPSPISNANRTASNQCLCNDRSDESDTSKSSFLDEWEPEWVKNIASKMEYLAGSENELLADAGVSPSKNSSIIDTSELAIDERSAVAQDFADSFVRVQWDNNAGPGNQSPSHDLLLQSFETQTKLLIMNLLSRENIDTCSWFDVIWPLVREIAYTVQPDLKERKDDMNLLSYVHVKTVRVLNVAKPSAQVIFGTVCTKHLTDSRMKQSFYNPKILIIGGSIEYERVEGKFCSIDPVMLQEKEYLRSVVHKIASRQPDVVIIEKSVARIAQDFFREAGISLICNVKSKVLRRIARCTQADIVYSIEGQLGQPNLGRCGLMHVETTRFSSSGFEPNDTLGRNVKSLLFFEDCPPDLGCAIVLTGSKLMELRKVKKIMKLVISLLYSGKLEISMLRALRVQNSPSLLKSADPAPDDRENEQQKQHEEADCDICAYNLEMGCERNIVEPTVDDESRRNFVEKVSEAVFHVSPFIRVCLPYLETKKGSQCRLRPWFNLDQLYRCTLHASNSKMFENERLPHPGQDEVLPIPEAKSNTEGGAPCVEEIAGIDAFLDKDSTESIGTTIYSFFSQNITKSASSYEMKRDIAKFRAESGTFFRRRREEMKRRAFLARVFSDSTPELSVDEEGTDSVLDVLDPQTHQRLAVLYCSYMASPAHDKVLGFCLKPRVFVMHYYGQFDCTLGDYLERYCFSSSYKCTNEACEGSMVGHIRKLVHGSSCVEISIQNLDTSGASNRVNDETTTSLNQILTWDWCPNCKLTTSTSVLQKEAWHLSFAKFLDYLFNGEKLSCQLVNESACLCCLLHSHVHHFANKNLVVVFGVSKINLRDICFPPLSRNSAAVGLGPLGNSNLAGNFNTNSSNFVPNFSNLMQELKKMGEKLIETLDQASDSISKVKQISENYKNSAWQSTIAELQMVYDEANTNFRLLINEAQSALANVKKCESRENLDVDAKNSTTNSDSFSNDLDSWLDICADKMHKSKCTLAFMVQKWNALTNDLNSLNKKKLDDKITLSPAISKPVEENNPASENSATSLATSAAIDESSPLKRISTSSADLNTSFICDRKSLTKLLSSMYLPSPFEPSEHFTLPAGIDGTSILVRDTELGSVVAYTLASEEYERCRRVIIEGWSRNDVPFSLRSNVGDAVSDPAAPSTNSVPETFSGDQNAAAASFAATSSMSPHVEVQFSDSSTKFYCKVYFAEHFRALRKLIFPLGERAFINCLSRCESWTPKGGKSGAVFNRTADRCFVLKQISRFELQSFNKFAPAYFDYVSSACQDKKLTALAKIFGVFRVGFNNTLSSTATKMDFIVMEYLFCDREVDRVYDLKGSLRNRLAPTAAANSAPMNASEEQKLAANCEDSVLLDVNLLRDICDNPFYMHPHAKAALNAAISNDSFFLSSNHIMDYSLLCGIDRERNELVVGIIDYMRTYTWDKRVESWVKSTVTVTGQLPTVISPELYRNRFVEIMDVYFPLAPDQWTGLSYSSTS